MSKKIASIRTVKPGKRPDIDLDIATEHRKELTTSHLEEVYGAGTTANINTFNTLKAASALKAMATIYQAPFAEANRATKLFPDPVEGKHMSLADAFNPQHPRYAEAEDFRHAVSGKDWKPIVEGAIAIEERIKSTGLHAAGILIASRPLSEVIPMKYVKGDNPDELLYASQWPFPECEALGLVKMDFLGLDTIDLHIKAVQYIMDAGMTPPSLKELYDGPKDDPETFAMLRTGETIGVFQLGTSAGVRELLKAVQPTEFSDISAITALYRPGPMGMGSHTEFAERKTGRKEVGVPIHPDFAGSPLEEILADTYGIIIYQEQVMQISNRVAGMTLQEGDDLRSAMGKKKLALMESMKAKFISGGQANGYSLEAMTLLWDTCAEFAQYGFNKSHAVAYSYLIYGSAYLKTHYPREFMAALLAQKVSKKDDLLELLKECRRMGLKVGPVSINSSQVNITPDYDDITEYDIIFGFNAIRSLSSTTGSVIVSERERGGAFKGFYDTIRRLYDAGVKSQSLLLNLANAGAFDELGMTRSSVERSLPPLLAYLKKHGSEETFSLFDAEEDDEETEDGFILEAPEYDWTHRLSLEREAIGISLSGHPMERMGSDAHRRLGVTTLLEVMKHSTPEALRAMGYPYRRTFEVVAVPTEVSSSTGQYGRRVVVTLDDGHHYLEAKLDSAVVSAMSLYEARAEIERLYMEGHRGEVPDYLRQAVKKPLTRVPVAPLDNCLPYVVSIEVKLGRDNTRVFSAITDIRPVTLTAAGELPVRLRFDFGTAGDQEEAQRLRSRYQRWPAYLGQNYAGEVPIMRAGVLFGYSQMFPNVNQNLLKTHGVLSNRVYAEAVSYMVADRGLPRTERGDIIWPVPHDGAGDEQVESAYLLDIPAESLIDYVKYVPTDYRVGLDEELTMKLQRTMYTHDYDYGRYVTTDM